MTSILTQRRQVALQDYRIARAARYIATLKPLMPFLQTKHSLRIDALAVDHYYPILHSIQVHALRERNH